MTFNRESPVCSAIVQPLPNGTELTGMKILAFRHVPFEGIGRIADSLSARGIAVEYSDLYLPGVSRPDWAKYNGLIFLGGPMSVNDHMAWIETELDIIRGALVANLPVLGICLGAQLISKALGCRK